MGRQIEMGDFEKEGFLGKEIEEYKNNRDLSDIEKRAKTIARAVNRVLFEFKDKIEVAENQIVDQALCALLARMIHSFSAVVILCNYGLSSDAHSVARNLIVEVFIAESIIKDKNNYNLYLAKYYQEKMRRLKKIRDNKNFLNYGYETKTIDQMIKECKDALCNIGIKDKVTEEKFAQKAGMKDDYSSFYTSMCDFVHSGIGTLDRFLNTNEKGVITEFDAGPEFEDVPLLLLSCSDYVLRVIQSFSMYFGIDQSAVLKKLFKDVRGELSSIVNAL